MGQSQMVEGIALTATIFDLFLQPQCIFTRLKCGDEVVVESINQSQGVLVKCFSVTISNFAIDHQGLFKKNLCRGIIA